ncbi:hypothetical protein MLPF_2177 [Mycobacterium lepromatosis]|nr:hypothetical protein MLPF_2177 [Mycobacterium lepromatosis]
MSRFTRGCFHHCPPQCLTVLSNSVAYHLRSPIEGAAVYRIDIDRGHPKLPLLGGAAGNRTRVLRHSLKASPCAVRYASTRISWSRALAKMTIPVAVGVPTSPATEPIGRSL